MSRRGVRVERLEGYKGQDAYDQPISEPQISIDIEYRKYISFWNKGDERGEAGKGLKGTVKNHEKAGDEPHVTHRVATIRHNILKFIFIQRG